MIERNLASEFRKMKNKTFLQKEDYIFNNIVMKISTGHVKSHRYERHYFFVIFFADSTHLFYDPNGREEETFQTCFPRLLSVTQISYPVKRQRMRNICAFNYKLNYFTLLNPIFRNRTL